MNNKLPTMEFNMVFNERLTKDFELNPKQLKLLKTVRQR